MMTVPPKLWQPARLQAEAPSPLLLAKLELPGHSHPGFSSAAALHQAEAPSSWGASVCPSRLRLGGFSGERPSSKGGWTLMCHSLLWGSTFSPPCGDPPESPCAVSGATIPFSPQTQLLCQGPGAALIPPRCLWWFCSFLLQ